MAVGGFYLKSDVENHLKYSSCQEVLFGHLDGKNINLLSECFLVSGIRKLGVAIRMEGIGLGSGFISQTIACLVAAFLTFIADENHPLPSFLTSVFSSEGAMLRVFVRLWYDYVIFGVGLKPECIESPQPFDVVISGMSMSAMADCYRLLALSSDNTLIAVAS